MSVNNDPPIPLLTKNQFAKAILDRIVQGGEAWPLDYDPKGFCLVTGGAPIYNLGNAYQEFEMAEPTGRAKNIRHYVRAWFSRHQTIPQDFADAAPDLLPKIVHRFSMEIGHLQSKIRNATPNADWNQVFGEHFAHCLVYDLPTTAVEIDLPGLAAWKVTPEEAYQVALKNLANRSRKTFELVAPGVLMGTWQDGYDSSRLLLLDVIRRPRVKGDPVIMVPNPGSLLLTGSNDPKGLSNLAKSGNELFNRFRPLSGIALRLHGNEWVPYLPDRRHPAFDTLDLLRLKTSAEAYKYQQQLLETLYRQRDEDKVVATVSFLGHPKTKRPFTYCLWQHHFFDAYLPRTDTVFFTLRIPFSQEDYAAMCSWDHVVNICGDLMEPQGMYPELYRVRQFPSETQLAKLKQADIRASF